MRGVVPLYVLCFPTCIQLLRKYSSNEACSCCLTCIQLWSLTSPILATVNSDASRLWYGQFKRLATMPAAWTLPNSQRYTTAACTRGCVTSGTERKTKTGEERTTCSRPPATAGRQSTHAAVYSQVMAGWNASRLFFSLEGALRYIQSSEQGTLTDSFKDEGQTAWTFSSIKRVDIPYCFKIASGCYFIFISSNFHWFEMIWLHLAIRINKLLL